jgi:hydrogenase expression/formation protein HypC
MCLSVPAKLVSVGGGEGLLRTGKVSLGGALKEISLAYVPEAQAGDYVLVHVGFALSVIDEAEAAFVQNFIDQNFPERGTEREVGQ